jgi:predicted aspartyl protease
MRIDGEWLQCEDAVVRPVLRAEIRVADGPWRAIELLVDTGADRTVFSANVLAALNVPQTLVPDSIHGIGGQVESVSLPATIRFFAADGKLAAFHSEFAACLQPEALDMSVLGRDLLELFALIIDRSEGCVALLEPPHVYTITPN